jgi:hypothetical protein
MKDDSNARIKLVLCQLFDRAEKPTILKEGKDQKSPPWWDDFEKNIYFLAFKVAKK